MKKLQNNFTTPEQSKRLLELGVPEDSADCYYMKYMDGEVVNEYEPDILDFRCDFIDIYAGLPCWSVGRLIEIMKICSIPTTTWYVKSDSKQSLIEFFMDDLESAIMERDIDFSKLEN